MKDDFLFFKDYLVIPKSKTLVIYGQRLASTILNSLGQNYSHAICPPESKKFSSFLELIEDHEVAIIVRDPIAKVKSGLGVAIPKISTFKLDENPDETLARDDFIKFKAELQKEVNESKWHVAKSGIINYTLGDSHLDWATEVMFYFMLSLGKMPKLYWLEGWEANSVNSIDLPNMVDFANEYFGGFPEVKQNLLYSYRQTGKAPEVFSEERDDKRLLIYQQIFSNATPHRIPNNKSRSNYINNTEYRNSDALNLVPRNPTEEFLTQDDINFYSYNDFMSDWYKMFNTMVTTGQDANFYNQEDRYDADRCKQIGSVMITDIYQNMSTKMNLDWIKDRYWKPVPGQHFLNMVEVFKNNPDLFPQFDFK